MSDSPYLFFKVNDLNFKDIENGKHFKEPYEYFCNEALNYTLEKTTGRPVWPPRNTCYPEECWYDYYNRYYEERKPCWPPTDSYHRSLCTVEYPDRYDYKNAELWQEACNEWDRLKKIFDARLECWTIEHEKYLEELAEFDLKNIPEITEDIRSNFIQTEEDALNLAYACDYKLCEYKIIKENNNGEYSYAVEFIFEKINKNGLRLNNAFYD